jgi:hypothetical protein
MEISMKFPQEIKNKSRAPVILATQEAEIRRIAVQSQPGQIVCETLSRKTLHKNRAGRVAQGEGPEFNPSTRKNKKEEEELSYDPAITLLCIFPKKCKSTYKRGNCASMFIVALFIIGKIWNQLGAQ